jgi:hypothetical protein
MNTDVEELLREGMERFTTGVQAPTGLARTAVRLRRRRRAIRAAVACGAVAVIAVTAIAVPGMAGGAPARSGPGLAQTRTAAYVISRVENALATEHRVLRGYATGGGWGPTITWVYGARTRFVEFTGRGCGHAAPSGACTHHGGSEPYLAQGDAIIRGKRYGVYVTYFDRKWSGGPGWEPMPPSACSRTGGLEMSGPAIVTGHWPAFIKATLGCGAATVTGHVRIDGRDTTKISGSPVTVRLQGGEARAVRENRVRARWTLYVDSTTYLPVRISGSNRSFGGPAPSYVFSTVTDIQWLRPTAANIAKTLVTVPPGFRRVKSPADQ